MTTTRNHASRQSEHLSGFGTARITVEGLDIHDVVHLVSSAITTLPSNERSGIHIQRPSSGYGGFAVDVDPNILIISGTAFLNVLIPCLFALLEKFIKVPKGLGERTVTIEIEMTGAEQPSDRRTLRITSV